MQHNEKRWSQIRMQLGSIVNVLFWIAIPLWAFGLLYIGSSGQRQPTAPLPDYDQKVRQLETLMRAHADPMRMARAHMELADACMTQKNYVAAEMELHTFQLLAETHGSDDDRCQAMMALGNLYEAQTKYQSAADFFQQSLDFDRNRFSAEGAAADRPITAVLANMLARDYDNLAVAYHLWGESCTTYGERHEKLTAAQKYLKQAQSCNPTTPGLAATLSSNLAATEAQIADDDSHV
jgi:tetratricopeptide (TPR) repeat protein